MIHGRVEYAELTFVPDPAGQLVRFVVTLPDGVSPDQVEKQRSRQRSELGELRRILEGYDPWDLPDSVLTREDLSALVSSAVSSLPDFEGITRFPRDLIQNLAEAGLIERRWRQRSAGIAGDVEFGILLSDELARQVPAGACIGYSLHTETVLSLLHRFGDNEFLTQLRAEAMAGRKIGCIAASEFTGGSDLSAIKTLATQVDDGWVISGRKKFVSLGAVADFAITLCQIAEPLGEPTGRTALIVVPLDETVVVAEHDKLGTHCLDTVAIEFDHVLVPDDAFLGRKGLGVLSLNYGLTFERLAIASQVTRGCELALSMAVEHAERRRQFGKALRDHQYLRFRMAEQLAEIYTLKSAVSDLAREVAHSPMNRGLMSRIAGVKLVAARAGERLISESMQVFGGAGYLLSETPLGQFWNDVRVARIGAGTDEMMLSIVSEMLAGETELYDRLVRIS
ncbi:acyl-CoA dehydrogenase family protein [Nocardia sp. NPDC055002]